jgi:hypothetical protein
MSSGKVIVAVRLRLAVLGQIASCLNTGYRLIITRQSRHARTQSALWAVQNQNVPFSGPRDSLRLMVIWLVEKAN